MPIPLLFICSIHTMSCIISYKTPRAESKAGHRSTLAFLRFCVIAATGIRNHTQVELLWITRRIRRISAFPINSERLDASVFTSTLPATKRNSRAISTRATDVIFERKHCSRRRSHTQVDITSAHKQLGNSRTITRNRWHGATISERKDARLTCGRLNAKSHNTYFHSGPDL